MPALPKEELAKVIPVLEKLRLDLQDASGGNKELLFSMKRYIAIRLHMTNAAHQQFVANLKTLKWKLQRGICAECKEELPIRGAELDRHRRNSWLHGREHEAGVPQLSPI